MTANPYDQPNFAAAFVEAEQDPMRNRYEWEVTLGALRCLLWPGMRAIDYGCGGGVFTAAMAQAIGPRGRYTGTDASPEMLRYAMPHADNTPGLDFQLWDATQTDSPLQEGAADLVSAMLVFNYLPSPDLHMRVLPRLRACLKSTGLLAATLPNPIKRLGYDLEAYDKIEEMVVEVGGFGGQLTTNNYHHKIEGLQRAAYGAGFTYATVLTLPEVRFDPHRQPMADPAFFANLPQTEEPPLDGLFNSRRLLYILGAGVESYGAFTAAPESIRQWRRQAFPESVV
ncbi:MAG TPA: class I SAM-dependent methyltransferase [Candidatus Saccharimonadales bacterium]|nr:class I SAM-dependent methyltransferase [Candidatus Saccharimonadales bacterium]